MSIATFHHSKIKLNTPNMQSCSNKPVKSFEQTLKNFLREFCRECSLHGVRYLGQRRTLLEK